MDVLGTCPICFEELKDRETATPDVCDHTFCLSCLQKWAKRGSFCPVDRKRFKKIINLSTSASIQIKPRKRKKERALYDISVHCEVCEKMNGADTLLLCDCCDLGYHCKCLTPPLSQVPSGVWNCPVCVAVSEKIRAKKGVTKELELIVHNHTNWKDSSSSSSESYFTNSSSVETLNGGRSNLSKSLKSDQPRGRKRINLGKNKFTESITSSDKEFTDTQKRKSRKISKGATDNISKLSSLRPRRRSMRRAYVYSDTDPSSSEGDTVDRFQQETYISNKSDKSVCSPMDLTSTSKDFQESKPLDLTRQEKNSLMINTAGAVHAAKNALPEATVTSCTIARNALPEGTETSCASASWQVHDDFNNDSELSDICLIENISSIFEEESSDAVDPTQTELPPKDVLCQRNAELSSEPMISLDKENIGKLLPTESPTEAEFGFEENSSEIEIISSGVRKDKTGAPENSDVYSCKLSEKVKPVFSVFEKLDNETSSQKKYSDINQAVYKIRHKSKCTATNKYEKKDAKSLSKELREIEKEKWKTYHLRSQKKRKLSPRLQCCNMHARYNSSDTVHIGRHFRQKRHSESFSKFLSVVKPMWNKEKWDKQDTVIFKSFINGKRGICSEEKYNHKPNYKPYIHNLSPVDNSTSSCEQSSKVCKMNSYPNHNIISVESKNLLELKKTESGLLGSVLCLSDVKNLALREDGSLFVNWQTCRS